MGPHAVRFACLAALLLALPALAQTPSTPEWISALRTAAMCIVFRHGATHNDQADTDPLDIQNVAKQRQLNDQGRALAKEIGDAMRALKIPVGKVRTSQFYRAVETGKLLGFGDGTGLYRHAPRVGCVVSPNENSRRTKAMRALAAAAPGRRHQYRHRLAQAEHCRCLWQGLGRRTRGRGVDLQARTARAASRRSTRVQAGDSGETRSGGEVAARRRRVLIRRSMMTR